MNNSITEYIFLWGDLHAVNKCHEAQFLFELSYRNLFYTL